MEQYRRYWSLLLITLSVAMVSLACDDHRNSLPTNSTEQGTENNIDTVQIPIGQHERASRKTFAQL